MSNSTFDFISELVIITVIGYVINRFAFWIGICIKIWCEEVIFKHRLWFSKGTTVKDICDRAHNSISLNFGYIDKINKEDLYATDDTTYNILKNMLDSFYKWNIFTWHISIRCFAVICNNSMVYIQKIQVVKNKV